MRTKITKDNKFRVGLRTKKKIPEEESLASFVPFFFFFTSAELPLMEKKRTIHVLHATVTAVTQEHQSNKEPSEY